MNAYHRALACLSHRVDHERTARGPTSLRAFREILKRLGHPERSLRSVVVLVGTKGKGSTAHHLSALAESLGLRVGLFTSPHLISYNERIRLQQHPVDPERFGETLLALDRQLESHGGGFRTVFELLTLTALQIFREEQVDLAIFEAGLGGRLDTTALLPARVLGVGPIHRDHTAHLGDTFSSIVREKIYPRANRIPAAVGHQPQVLADTVRQIARALYAPVLQEGWEYRLDNIQTSTGGTRARLFYPAREEVIFLETPARGKHQAHNAALAWIIMEILWGEPLPPHANFRMLQLPGRLHRIGIHPPVYVDGAHNALAFQALKEALTALHPDHRWIGVLAMNRDKAGADVHHILRTWNVCWIATRTPSPRSLDPETLMRKLSDLCWIDRLEDPGEAVQTALERAQRERKTGVVITGSFYLSGAILPWLLQTARVPG